MLAIVELHRPSCTQQPELALLPILPADKEHGFTQTAEATLCLSAKLKNVVTLNS